MFKILFAKQKKLPWKPKRDRGAKPCLSRFPRELRVRCFARDARPYSTERSAPIPDSNPASRTGRVLSHLSIQLTLYSVNSINAIPDITFPQFRGLFPLIYERKTSEKNIRAPARKPEAEEGPYTAGEACSILFHFVPLLRLKSGTYFFSCLSASSGNPAKTRSTFI